MSDLIRLPHCVVYFGDKASSLPALQGEFPDFDFRFLKQTHSDIVIAARPDSSVIEADAHWTRRSREALCIRTADCIPVLIYSTEPRMVAAVHAGWRGVASNITGKTIARLLQEGAHTVADQPRFSTGVHVSELMVWIGPHIGAVSFEVSKDVGAILANAYALTHVSPTLAAAYAGAATLANAYSDNGVSDIFSPHEDPLKVRVSLELVVRAQLAAAGVRTDQISTFSTDTFMSAEHHSFRRDREAAGRQISFIALV